MSSSALRSLLHLSTCAVLLAFLGGCAALRRPDPPIDRSQDPRIQREVELRLAQEPSLRDAGIRVVVEGRMVLLHGSVPGLAAWQCALRNAELVEGVTGVVDYLILARGPREVRCLAPRSLDGAPG